jgi:hypothetical protein
VGALPLLSYTIDDMWRAMLKAGDGVLRFPAQSIDLGRVLVERAETPKGAQFEPHLIPYLAASFFTPAATSCQNSLMSVLVT